MWFSRQAGSKCILDDLDRLISKFDPRSSQVKVTCVGSGRSCFISLDAPWRDKHIDKYHFHVCISIESSY